MIAGRSLASHPSGQVSEHPAPSSCAIAAGAALFGYSPATAHMPAATATRQSMLRKSTIKSAPNASPPVNYASNSAACQTLANHCRQSPNGSTKNAITTYAITFKHSKARPIDASVKRSMFAPSPSRMIHAQSLNSSGSSRRSASVRAINSLL